MLVLALQLTHVLFLRLLPMVGHGVFGPAARGGAIITAGLIMAAVPLATLYRLMRRRGSNAAPTALALSFIVYFSLAPIAVYWTGYLIGFRAMPVSLVFTLLSIIGIAAGGGGREIPREPKTTTTDFPRGELIAAVVVLALFAVCITLPFSYVGQITSEGACLTAVGDHFEVNSVTASILASGIPPRQPYFCSAPLNYYYFYHLLAATLVLLSGYSLSITAALQCTLVFTSACLLFSFYAVVRSWLPARGAALCSLTTATFIGGLDLIPLALLRIKTGEWLRHADAWERWQLFKIHCPLTNFHYYPQHMTAALLLMGYIFVINRKYTLTSFLIASVIITSICGYSSLIFPTLIITIGLKYLLDLAALIWKRRLTGAHAAALAKQIALRGAEAIAGFALIFPHAIQLWVSQRMAPIKIACRLPALGAVALFPENYRASIPLWHLLGVAGMEFLDFGAVGVLALLGIIYVRQWENIPVKRFLLAMTVGIILFINCFQVDEIIMGGSEFSMKMSAQAWLGLAVLAGWYWSAAGLDSLFDRAGAGSRRLPRAKTALLLSCSVLALLGFLTVPFELSSLCIPDTIDVDEYQAFCFMRENLPWNGIVQRAPEMENIYLAVPNWGWRLTRAGDYCGSRRWFTDQKAREDTAAAIETAFRSPTPQEAHGRFQRLKIDYLYLGNEEKKRFGTDNLRKFENAPGLFKTVFENCSVRIVHVE